MATMPYLIESDVQLERAALLTQPRPLTPEEERLLSFLENELERRSL